MKLEITPVNYCLPQELMKIFENHTCQLKRVAPSIADNQKLRKSMETLEKMLAKAHANQEKLQAEKTQLEVEN